jgi:hypothetical protein
MVVDLPRAVGAEIAGDLAGADGERQPIEDAPFTELPGQLLDDNHSTDSPAAAKRDD